MRVRALRHILEHYPDDAVIDVETDDLPGVRLEYLSIQLKPLKAGETTERVVITVEAFKVES